MQRLLQLTWRYSSCVNRHRLVLPGSRAGPSNFATRRAELTRLDPQYGVVSERALLFLPCHQTHHYQCRRAFGRQLVVKSGSSMLLPVCFPAFCSDTGELLTFCSSGQKLSEPLQCWAVSHLSNLCHRSRSSHPSRSPSAKRDATGIEPCRCFTPLVK